MGGLARALSLLLLAAAPVAARAEWVADFYGGVAYSPRSDFTLQVRPAGLNFDHTFYSAKWDTSTAFGVRGAYWFEALPWYGVGLDLFWFNADLPMQTVEASILGTRTPTPIQTIDFSMTGIGFDILRLRYGLMTSSQYPKGRLQPYVSAGPALFMVKVQNKGNGELSTRPGTDSVMGYKLGAGTSWQLSREAAVFGEYRFTRFHAEPALDGAITGAHIPIPFTLKTHHFVAGLSFRF